jgi:hypothetical protein
MSTHASHDFSRRRLRPVLEGLETRVLLDREGPNLPGRHYPAAHVQQFVPYLYPPGTPQPTRAEVARESFVAKGYGYYTVGPGRFNTQSITIHGYGKPASSNFSSVSHFQYAVFEPTDPAKPVTGVMNVFVEDFPATGGSLILDLEGPTGTEVDGLPTHLYWARDATSGTFFTGTGSALPGYPNFPANYFTSNGTLVSPLEQGLPPSSVDNWNLAVGDATFKYIPDKHPQKGTIGSGRVIFLLRGLINNSGVQSADDQNYD